MKKLMMIAAVVAVVSAFAADVKVVAKDYDEKGVWKEDGTSLTAEDVGDDAEATVATPGAGSCYCWARVLVGSKLKIGIDGTEFAPEAKGDKGQYVWVKLGMVMVPAGYTAVTLHQVEKVKSAVAEVFLTCDAEWKPPVQKPAVKKEGGEK